MNGRCLYISAVVLANVSLVASVPPLVAQGGPKTNRPAASPPAPPSAGQPRLEPARSVLRHLVGRWRFEIWFAGNFDGAPDASGTRVVEALFDDLRVQWTEEVEHSEIRGQGIIGFDPHSSRFYSTSVSSGGSGAEFMTGTLDPAEPLVAFSPIAPSPGARSFTLSILDPDHFTISPSGRGWRAVFTRQH